jgi:iron complex outermembrane receptor protein
MKRLLSTFIFVIVTLLSYANYVEANDTLTHTLDEISVVSFYRVNLRTGTTLSRNDITIQNKGQEPSFILARMPSVFAYSDTGNEYGYSYFRMRGMDQTRINITLDGMPLNDGEDMGVYFSNFPDLLSSMHSIKVENGASIANNGAAGYAGSVNFESINLEQDTISSAYVGYGSFNTLKAGAEYNTGRKGNFAGHFKATHQQSDGFREHAYNNAQSIFVKLGWYIHPQHKLELLSFVGQSRNGMAWIGATAEEIEQNPTINGCSNAEIDHYIQNINKLQYQGMLSENITMTASAYYNYADGYYTFDVDNYMRRVYDPGWQTTEEIDRYDQRFHYIGGNIAAKFYLNPFELTTGVNASTFNRRHVGSNNLQEELLWDNVGYKNDISAFVKGTYTYRQLSVGANVQYRHTDFDYKGDKPFERINWDFLNWSANVRWQFNNLHALYASATQTHREPTRSDMFGGEENFTTLYTTQAESVIDYELGYNITLHNFTCNLNLYYMDFENELILNGAMGTNGQPIHVNAAQSYRSGIELSAQYYPIENLRLTNNSSFSINQVKHEGETLTHILSPTWLVNQEIGYKIAGFDIGVTMRYRSAMYFDLTNLYSIPQSLRFNLSVAYTYRNITAGIHLNNIFDERSYSNGMMGSNAPLYFVDAPRNIWIDARVRF